MTNGCVLSISLLGTVALLATPTAATDLGLFWDTGDIGIVQDITIADLQRDGVNEVLVGIESGGPPHRVLVYDGVTKNIIDSIEILNGYPNQISVADIDGDSADEIIVGSVVRASPDGYVYVFDALTFALEWTSDNLGEVATLGVADFDLDGDIEIFVGSNGPPLTPSYGPIGGRITLLDGATHAIEYSDTTATGFKVAELASWGNLDTDSSLEVLFGTNDYVSPLRFAVHELDCETHEIRLRMDSTGAFYGSVLGAVDKVGTGEIVLAYRGGQPFSDRVAVLSAQWELQWEFSLQAADGSGFYAPAMANMNGTRALDVAVGVRYVDGHDSVIVLDGHTGAQVWSTETVQKVSVLAIGDVNKDGAKELFVGTGSGVLSGRMRAYEPLCACDCHVDPAPHPMCDGANDILDVVECIDVAFRGRLAIRDPVAACPYESTDANCSLSTDILDVVLFINVAFRGDDAWALFCNPCQ